MSPQITEVNGELLCHDSEHSGAKPRWCNHIAKLLNEGKDILQASLSYSVPIFPSQDVFVSVRIGSEMYGDSALMDMIFVPEIGNIKTIPLGFWNPGEGRITIRSVVIDHLLSQIDPRDVPLQNSAKGNEKIYTKCPSSVHNLEAQRLLDKSKGTTWRWVCLWNIVFERACTPCMEESNDPTPDPIQNLPGQNKPPWVAPVTGATTASGVAATRSTINYTYPRYS